MTNKIMRLAALAVVVMGIFGSASSALAQQVQLRARANKSINGIEAELRGNYRANPNPDRLESELDNINVPVGTKVAFCLLQNGTKTLLGVGQVTMVGGVPTAIVELEAELGDNVPSVNAGDVLQARQKKAAPFKSSPNCGTKLLVSAAFQ